MDQRTLSLSRHTFLRLVVLCAILCAGLFLASCSTSATKSSTTFPTLPTSAQYASSAAALCHRLGGLKAQQMSSQEELLFTRTLMTEIGQLPAPVAKRAAVNQLLGSFVAYQHLLSQQASGGTSAQVISAQEVNRQRIAINQRFHALGLGACALL